VHAARDALAFDEVTRVAPAGGINERDGDAFDINRFRHEIACCAWYWRHDCAFCAC
jgi:hypothetical protein